MVTKKKGVIIVLLLLLAGGAAYWFLFPGREEEPEILPHQVTEVERSELSREITTSGYLAPLRSRSHSPEQGGEIVEIPVDPGDEVQAGDALYRLNDSEQYLDYIQARNAYQQALIGGSEREIEEQELSMELAEERLEDRTIRSRLDGTVDDFDLEEGDTITSESTGITVEDESGYIVEIDLDEIDAPMVEEGMESTVALDAFPDNNYTGEVSHIERGTKRDNGSVVVPAEISIAENDERFRSGYSADVDIIIESREDVLMVPITAVYEREGQEYVVTVDEEYNPQPAEVETGLSDDINVEITSGLEAGQRILINAHQYAEDVRPDWQFGPGAGPPPGTPGGEF